MNILYEQVAKEWTVIDVSGTETLIPPVVRTVDHWEALTLVLEYKFP
jgi:hypothetical protein